jgi:hypothetical protein
MANSNKNGSTEPRPVFRPEDVTIRGYVPRPKKGGYVPRPQDSQASSGPVFPVKVPTNPPNQGSGGKKERD